MSNVKVEWHGDEWLRKTFLPAVNAGLDQAAILAQRKMRMNMGSEGGGVLRQAKKRKKNGKFVKNSPGKGRNVYFASPPGRFPGVRTGSLTRSIMWWRPRSAANNILAPFVRVGVPSSAKGEDNKSVGFYAGVLEKSRNPKMRRPWAARTIKESKKELNKVFSRTVFQRLGRN